MLSTEARLIRFPCPKQIFSFRLGQGDNFVPVHRDTQRLFSVKYLFGEANID